MAAIRARDTKPELLVRSYIHRQGLRFRVHRRDLPGTPDLVFPRHKAVVFIHGCFWHHHGCSNSVWPKVRRDFWRAKITSNIERDEKTEVKLEALGWRVFTVWECETDEKRLSRLVHRIRQSLRRTLA